MSELETEANNATGKKKTRTGSPKNTAILILCMGIAFFLWLMVQLSQNYTGDILVHISYSNLPKNKVSVFPLVNEGHARVNASGFRLLWANMRWGRLDLDIDYDRYNNAEYILADNIVDNALTELPSGYTLIGFYPDTLHLSFARKKTKKVPIVLERQLTMAKQFDLKGDIQLSPDSITITGPKSIVDTLTSWNTELLVLNKLKETISDTIRLLDTQNPGITLSHKHIVYTVPVEMLTESEIEVPIGLENAPLGVDVAIFPKQVTLTFMVGLSNQDNASNAAFKVVANFQDVDLEKDEYAPLEIKQVPNFIKNPILSPETVEYIIYQE